MASIGAELGMSLGGAALFVFLIGTVNLWWTEKRKVQKMPRVPMVICDTHGTYPQSAALKMTVPSNDGRADLEVDVCPQCYRETQSKVEAKLRQLRQEQSNG